MRSGLLVLCVGALVSADPLLAEGLCRAWSHGETLGELDSRMVSEASGLAVSRLDSERLYHINDSGGGPYFYLSGLDGGGLRRIRIDGAGSLIDTEALATGEVAGESVLVVGDIGDNLQRRRTVELLAIRERDIGPGTAPVFARASVRYPDGPHNAEAMLLGPDGTLYLLTKSWSELGHDSAPARIFRLDPKAWSVEGGAVVTLELVGQIDLPALAIREKALFSDVVTDAAMAADGSRFLILTYGYAWELAFDLASQTMPPAAEMQRGRDYQVIRLEPLLGKESIAYLPGEAAFLFGKEFKPDSRPSNLIRLTCLDE